MISEVTTIWYLLIQASSTEASRIERGVSAGAGDHKRRHEARTQTPGAESRGKTMSSGARHLQELRRQMGGGATDSCVSAVNLYLPQERETNQAAAF